MILRTCLPPAIFARYSKKVYWPWVLTWIPTKLNFCDDPICHRGGAASESCRFCQNPSKSSLFACFGASLQNESAGREVIPYWIITNNRICNLLLSYLVEIKKYLASEAFLGGQTAFFWFFRFSILSKMRYNHLSYDGSLLFSLLFETQKSKNSNFRFLDYRLFLHFLES